MNEEGTSQIMPTREGIIRMERYLCRVHGEVKASESIKNRESGEVVCMLCWFEGLVSQFGTMKEMANNHNEESGE